MTYILRMARHVPKPGVPWLIQEIINKQSQRETLEGISVRVVGLLKEHRYQECMAKVADPQTKACLYVDTSLVEPIEGSVGSLFEFVGEIDCLDERCDVLLKARVAKCVDSLDFNLYKQAILSQREYFRMWNSSVWLFEYSSTVNVEIFVCG